MADVGTTQSNLPAGLSSTPNADSMGVDPSLEALAAYIVAAQNHWVSKDFPMLENSLQGFWAAEGGYGTPQTQSMGTLIGGTVQADIVALDGYSHRIMGFDYMYRISAAAPADIPGICTLEVGEFTKAVADWNACGLTVQAQDDQLTLNQCQGWAQQTADAWIDDSYVTAVKATVNSAVSSATNLLEAAAAPTVNGSLSFLTSPAFLIGAAVILSAFLFTGRRK